MAASTCSDIGRTCERRLRWQWHYQRPPTGHDRGLTYTSYAVGMQRIWDLEDLVSMNGKSAQTGFGNPETQVL